MASHLTATECMINGLVSEDKIYLSENFFMKKVFRRGRSIFTKRPFKKGDYVMEYKGSCYKYDEKEFMSRHDMYEKNGELSYCLEFCFKNQKYFIDATREYTFGISRLVNHAKNPNLKLFNPIQVELNGPPRIAMYAAANISAGEELFWDYFSTLNPIKCLLNPDYESVPNEMQWIFCRRKKSGVVTCRPTKRRTYDRSGMCTICYEFKKKLSNHLINVHKISSLEKRKHLIYKGRQNKLHPNQLQKNSFIPKYICPVCNREYKQLHVHLSRIHKFNFQERKEIFEKIKSKEIKIRKKLFSNMISVKNITK